MPKTATVDAKPMLIYNTIQYNTIQYIYNLQTFFDEYSQSNTHMYSLQRAEWIPAGDHPSSPRGVQNLCTECAVHHLIL